MNRFNVTPHPSPMALHTMQMWVDFTPRRFCPLFSHTNHTEISYHPENHISYTNKTPFFYILTPSIIQIVNMPMGCPNININPKVHYFQGKYDKIFKLPLHVIHALLMSDFVFLHLYGDLLSTLPNLPH